MISSTKWLEERGQEYLVRIGEQQPTFLGELSVEEADLAELFKRIRLEWQPGRSDAVRACTAVAAVQAAVHATENHSSYIELFCSQLERAVDQGSWNYSYGPAILQFLREHFDEIDRPGAFRYVRPILNQSGISLRAMPSFAKFLSGLLESFGMGFTHDEYVSRLRGVTSRFGRRFLVEGPGFEFTRDAARTLDRIATGLIPNDQIGNIPGYRRGFWPELLSHLETSQGGKPAVRSLPVPAEYLDVDNNRLVVRFDEEGVWRGAYFLDGRKVNYAVQSIDSTRTLSGAIQRPGPYLQSWTLDPWLPGKSEWALFRISDGRMLCEANSLLDDRMNSSVLAPGEYLLAARDSTRLPPEVIVAEGPYLDSDGSSAELYRIWSVKLV
jgi:hypothetical protein